MERKKRYLDPRVGLLLLVLANVISFRQKAIEVEVALVLALTLLTAVYGCRFLAVKWAAGFAALLCLQRFVLPASPKIIATSFSIFINYARRMFPCLMIGVLMVKKTPLRNLIVGLRWLHVPQKLIIAVSVTLRYFPAIREEMGYIRDAIRLRGIRGLERLECMVVPLMVSATGTAEELSAAAVTRGVENPAPKTSLVKLRLRPLDYVELAAGLCLTVAAVVL